MAPILEQAVRRSRKTVPLEGYLVGIWIENFSNIWPQCQWMVSRTAGQAPSSLPEGG
jgi:hypothetical protein